MIDINNQSKFDQSRKMLSIKNHSTLNTTKSDTYRYLPASALLRQSVSRISMKFSTTQSYYLVSGINQAVESKSNFIKGRKCKLQWILKDQEYDREEEVLERYYPLENTNTQLKQLTEYYKYYTQTSIIYQPSFFKLMHHHREKKKVVEYNRLKVLLNLSDTTQRSENSQRKMNATPISSFYILSKLNVTNKEDQQSEIFAKLKNNMERTLGPNCYKTVQELDRNYHFSKKGTEGNILEVNLFRKIKLQKQEKQNLNIQMKQSKIKHSKRNNSCDFQNNFIQKPEIVKKNITKKKHFSMDNLTNIIKQYQGKQKKSRMYGNWVKGEPFKMSRIETHKNRERNSQQKFKSEENERDSDVKSKIMQTKQRIKRQKQMLKKKTTLTTNPSESFKSSKKTTMVTSPETHKNRKLMKITFY